jgi:hypothetical protein
MTLIVACEDLVVPEAHHFENSGVSTQVLLVLTVLQAAQRLRTW